MKEKKSIRILFIESSQSNVESASKILQKEFPGLSILKTKAKEEFVDSLEKFKPDVIISDYKLMDFSGIEALKLTINHSPRTPFIFLTAPMDEKTAVECMKAGAFHYLTQNEIASLPVIVKEACESVSMKEAINIAKQELFSNEEKYRLFFENNNNNYLIVDPLNLTIKDANQAVCNYYKYSRKDFLNKPLADILLMKEVEIKLYLDKPASKKPNSFIAKTKLKNGEIREVEIFWGTIYKKRKEPLIYLIIQDYAERMHTAGIMNKSVEFQKLLIDLSTEFINTPIEKLDRAINNTIEAAGKFAGVDRAYIFKYDKDSNTISNTYEWCAEWSSKKINERQNLTINILSSWIEAQKKGKIVFINSVSDYNKDLKLKSFLEELSVKSLVSLPMMFHGEFIGFIGFETINEIHRWTELEINLLSVLSELLTNTEVRRQRDIALKENENLLRILAKATGTVIYRLRFSDMKYEYIHPAIEELTGYTPDEINEIGFANLVYKVYSPEGKEVNRAEMKEKRDEGKTESSPIDYLIKTKCGKYKWISDRSFLVKDDIGEVYGSIGVLTDVSLRKQAEEEIIKAKEKAEEISRLKTNFLTNMSHELRTPLVGILGAAQILDEELDNSDYKEWVSIILQAGNRLLETQGLILDFSKIEAEKILPKYLDVPLNSVITSIAELFESMAVKKGLFIKTEIPDSVFHAQLDERLLREVISNLVNNAIKYTHVGGVTITLERDNDFAIIKVSDTGIGIPEEKFEYIFEEFRQVSEGVGRGFEGSGLGLTITKRFVELMKGSIYVESKIGEGSVFTVKLPVNISSRMGLE